ncbi:hypothetical protein JX265_000307 [Neoarthrinium moseri]|uniref:DUF2278 family protein n=1 Tax=Neoarthrinium moseri TaxID=1658444 RepID=A0A9P9WYJ9_9PEZI|nr:uncharacterized protein JN550_000557 [Neoarthrinium moseri]KAI1842649.1 hypothetical protein JX266_011111 [Neoarthrinium moseri]KAI1878375.1 hypothetical protein JN550_000557 [Neoarthrinium moseri]KAI1881481.1 hypothetical protein JX265_000307 [Neoarthrinium moseri]
MTIPRYGVWRGTATKWEPTQRDNDHGHITFTDGESDDLDCAVDVKSKDSDSRIVFWDVVSFDSTHPLTQKLDQLAQGYHAITDHTSNGLGLDYLKGKLVNVNQGRILDYQENGPDNDILDFLNPILNAAVSQGADMYLFGSKYSSDDGIHDIHMNQGDAGRFAKENGVYQDGGMIFNFGSDGEMTGWQGVFLAFATQAEQTDSKGNAMGPTFAQTLG